MGRFCDRELGFNFRAHTEPIFESLYLLKVHDIYNLTIHKFYYKLVNITLPCYFNIFVLHHSEGNIQYNLRNPNWLWPKIMHEYCSTNYKWIKLLIEAAENIHIDFSFSLKQLFIWVYNCTLLHLWSLWVNICECVRCIALKYNSDCYY